MAGRTMDVSVLVRLVDRLTGPLGALQRRFAQFAALGQRIGILGAAAAAISFMAPIHSAAAFDQALRDNVVTAGYWGDAAEAQIRRIDSGVSHLALMVGIASSQLADARGLLIAAGMEEALTDKLLPTIGRVSKAASALPADVSKVAFALNNTLGIAAEDMERQLAKLVVAGKLGRFEFRNMAKEIPGLAAQFAKLGVVGDEAVTTLGASLQVAMFGTDDPAAAANNFKNFLAKILSPDAIKNFKEDFGVDIVGVMQNAAARGINPIEAAIEKIVKLTGTSVPQLQKIFQANKSKGMTDAEATAAALQQIEKIAGASKLGQLFGDMQVMDFLLPMLANIDAYKRFKKEIGDAGLDVIAQDFATQWAGVQTQLTLTSEIGEQTVRRIGIGFAALLPTINQWGITMLNWVRQIDAQFPGLIDQVLSYTGVFLAAVAALAVTGPIFTVLSAAAGAAAAALSLILSPIGLIVAGLAAIAYLIYSDWENFAPLFSSIWDGVKEFAGGGVQYLKGLFSGDWSGMMAGIRRLAAGSGQAWRGVVNVIQRVGRTILSTADQYLGGVPSKVAGIVGGVWRAITAAVTTIGGRVGTALEPLVNDILAWARGVPDRIAGAFGEKGESFLASARDLGNKAVQAVKDGFAALASMTDADWTNLGTRLGNALVDAVKLAVDSLSSFFTGLPGRIRAWIGSIDISSLIRWPALPDWMRSFGGNGASPGTTAPSGAPAAPAPSNDNRPEWLKQGAGRLGQLAPASSLASRANVSGQIVVSAAPGATVERVESRNSDVPLKTASNGPVVGRV